MLLYEPCARPPVKSGLNLAHGLPHDNGENSSDLLCTTSRQYTLAQKLIDISGAFEKSSHEGQA